MSFVFTILFIFLMLLPSISLNNTLVARWPIWKAGIRIVVKRGLINPEKGISSKPSQTTAGRLKLSSVLSTNPFNKSFYLIIFSWRGDKDQAFYFFLKKNMNIAFFFFYGVFTIAYNYGVLILIGDFLYSSDHFSAVLKPVHICQVCSPVL